MKYRYYVHDTMKNVGVTEFSSDIPWYFTECLLDVIEWFMYESDETCLYEIKVFEDEEETEIKFGFEEIFGDSEMIAYFNKDGIVKSVPRDNVRDYVKSR